MGYRSEVRFLRYNDCVEIWIPASVMFILGYGCHWLVWQVKVPQRQSLSLIGIFLAVLPAYFLVTRIFPSPFSLPPHAVEFTYVLLIYFSAAFVYCSSFPGIEFESTYFKMLRVLERAAENGIGKEAFSGVISNENAIEGRLISLVIGGFVCRRGENLSLTEKGKLALHVMLLPRRWMGSAKRGG